MKKIRNNDYALDDITLVKAKSLLKDLETNIDIGRKNLCVSCKYFNPTQVTSNIKRVEEGFGIIGRCTSASNIEVPELNIPVWKCEIKERELKEVIKKIELSIIKAVGDDIPTAKQFINYKESINGKLNFVVWVLYIIITVTAITGVKLHLEIKELKQSQKSGAQNE